MRVVLQRTTGCEVRIGGRLHAAAGPGLLLLFGTVSGDAEASCAWLADKIVNLRIFEDEAGKMNRSALEVGAEMMVVSQFTLYADTRRGRRPSFDGAMAPDRAEQLYDRFVELLRDTGLTVATGVFGAHMDVSLTNHGPVTFILEHGVPAA
ncbi:MAG TPA: D-aminoacyl-tRNA deacylase [candidate division Zixibacteria bacterium]|nr:D-tyrosyl-tRNA(Tyr) deacylase [candidate division Zixibacteria bacterium]MDD4916914.1 D-aminoacyl-tRNA deacylase [candidate division Zixibacteria bacterium]MDM7972144.1 D-aminoacyl-tRNA deacylase [candidate division Zixibacteria bacterium]HOD66722.1 D-aminoacyl-tRNA deacylase [candidate division Zixibacteria bacterium]HOZ08352.1 D-aminoacyl-tRNA deacylase [candidate division Zixibacteria bacterium]